MMERQSTEPAPSREDGALVLELVPGRILLAEDDLEMRRMLASALRKEGHQVYEVADGDHLKWVMNEMLAGDADEIPDVVVSDLRMPGRTGIDALVETGRDRWPTPFVLLTAFGDEDTLQRAREAGADIVLDKPVDVATLKQVVRILIAS